MSLRYLGTIYYSRSSALNSPKLESTSPHQGIQGLEPPRASMIDGFTSLSVSAELILEGVWARGLWDAGRRQLGEGTQ